jgi:FkbM family methyltransferase
MPRTPPLNLNIMDVIQSFRASFPTNMKIMRSLYGLRALEIFPGDESPLRLISEGNEIPFIIPTDDIIGTPTFLTQKWDCQKVEFFATKINELNQKICLVDVGANIGLFTRQIASKTSLVDRAFLYEPHPENFYFLKRNLERWTAKHKLLNAAISDIEGSVDFFEDPTNCGNYSLNIHANGGKHGIIKVDCIKAELAEAEWLSTGLPIFYKSDTQGLDEKIATSLSITFWEKVQCAALELWRIKKPTFDEEKLEVILNSFTFKAFESNPSRIVQTNEVFEYLSALDGNFDDLLCWR